MSDSPVISVIGTNGSRVIGSVKFFDKNAGFGFISVLKNAEFPQFSEKDIFVHYSGIHIDNQQYKYLVKGEYVEFKIVPSTKPGVSTDATVPNENEKFNAVDITGIQGGKLMCETNYSEYIPKANRYTDDAMDLDVVAPPIVRRPVYAGRGDGGRGQYAERSARFSGDGGRGRGRGPPANRPPQMRRNIA